MAKLSSTDIHGDLTVDGTIRGTVNGSITGNAATATALQNARTINGTSFNGTANITTANWGTARTLTIGSTGKSVNGSANVSWSLSEIGAAASGHTHDDRYFTESEINTKLSGKSDTGHTHSYLPLTGGQLTGKLYMPSTATSSDSSHPTQLAYGLLGAYGTLKVLGNTDTNAGADSEYVHIAAGWGLSPAADKGITVHGTYANCFGQKILTRYEKIIDLSNTTTYPVDKWYPCIPSNGLPSKGMSRLKCTVHLNSGSKPSWSTHDNGFTCICDILDTPGGWGTASPHGICLDYQCNWTTDNINPCGYSQLANSSKPVFWLRGGGKYIMYADYDAGTWTVYTASTTLSSQTFEPVTACPGVSISKATIHAHLKGDATNAITLKNSRTINGTSFNGSANITTANWGTARNITIGNTAKSVNGSANVSWTLSEIGAAASSHNHTSLTGITSLTFAANSDDSSVISVVKDGSVTYTDFTMSDDAGSDMWRWRFSAWDSTASATAATFNAMTLKATSTTKAQLAVTGNVSAESFTENGTALSSKYAAASHGTHLTIGTGAGNAAAGNHTHSGYASSSHTHNYLTTKGTNTITSTSSDTTANWGAHGHSVHWYTANGQLTGQPSQWGYIANYGSGSEVHQIWMTQASGDMYHRGGNASGWSGSWRKLLDTSNSTQTVKVTQSEYNNATKNSNVLYVIVG